MASHALILMIYGVWLKQNQLPRSSAHQELIKVYTDYVDTGIKSLEPRVQLGRFAIYNLVMDYKPYTWDLHQS